MIAKTKPTMIMMCGLPGSGKSFLSAQYAEKGYVIHSSDAIREELLGDINNQDNNQKVFDELHRRIKQDLIDGKNVVYDATNLSRKRRVHFLRQLQNIDCNKKCILVYTYFRDCLENNKKRTRQVPENVIEKMLKSFQVPYYNEGFDEIEIRSSCEPFKDEQLSDMFRYLNDIEQDNPHHDFSIGKHCARAAAYISHLTKTGDSHLTWAAGLHDIGKAFCKTFKNAKGEETEIAHYYGHENVSAYFAINVLLSYFSTKETLYISYLINNHMRFNQMSNLNWDKQVKARSKLMGLVGPEIYRDLHSLYLADENSRKESHNDRLSE